MCVCLSSGEIDRLCVSACVCVSVCTHTLAGMFSSQGDCLLATYPELLCCIMF